jgi:hypothetical protein
MSVRRVKENLSGADELEKIQAMSEVGEGGGFVITMEGIVGEK